jgi:hypothetical protein
MTTAELLILTVALVGLAWLLGPLRRWIRDRLAKLIGGSRNGRVIQGDFRVIPPESKDKK